MNDPATTSRLVELPGVISRRILGERGRQELRDAWVRGLRYLPQPWPTLVCCRTEDRGWCNSERLSVTVPDVHTAILGLFEGRENRIWLGIDGPRSVKLPPPVQGLWHELAHAFERAYGLPADLPERSCSTMARRWQQTPPTDAELAALAALAKPVRRSRSF